MALRLIIGRFCCESSCYEMLSWGQNISVFHMITCIWSQPIRMVQRAICWFWPPLLITCGGSPGSFFLQKALIGIFFPFWSFCHQLAIAILRVPWKARVKTSVENSKVSKVSTTWVGTWCGRGALLGPWALRVPEIRRSVRCWGGRGGFN